MTAVRPARRPVRAALALAALAAVGLSACSSAPSAKRVALDMIETLDISESAKACMTQKVEDYPEGDLEKIAELADNGDAEGLKQLNQFSDDLATCVQSG